mmetsp:Transcript_15648/g.22920  ORF Transcript_15648/g.22920 Transcript_15648/m.22920 type:complete len:440 (-) Transcript_15648:122-1441(-)|eukprot:CAMPEP_0197232842 /NCGR_PEP_ID=MMETSP1429-20130617/1068_1 /TAXON_ID=49237 /ORGANISM="Chaetoceros  sp., Strain UNC1202" /LENGTH=439 /DNA_ID=CAMNT_0042690981 /DNA_START=127 /DNA_END=1446 /DNA_ORIENTATION=-
MAEFSKRPEITIDTMGKVHNPSGSGVKAVSSEVKKKTTKLNANAKEEVESHDTKVKEVGSSRRNITRKKGGNDQLFDSNKKKQGGAGKGKWQALDGSDMADIPDALDENDPNYDDFAEVGKYILSSTNGAESNGDDNAYDPVADRIVYGSMLTLAEFKIRIAQAIKEYFDSADADEVIRSIQEMKCKPYHTEVVKRAISLSLDEGPRERELTSRLLTSLHPYPLEDSDVEKGFDILLDSLEDLSIDIPDAKSMVGSFLARAIVDEVLPPAFITNRNNNHPGDEVTEKAVTLLSREHCTARLEKVWGPGDGRPVAELKEVIDQLAEEYLLSRELDEAARCVREMNAPHFHHELVKRGVKLAMERDGSDHSDSGVSALDAVAALFSFLVKNAIVSEHQVSKGVSRLHRDLGDIKLDVPAAPAMLEEFEQMAREGGCMMSAP